VVYFKELLSREKYHPGCTIGIKPQKFLKGSDSAVLCIEMWHSIVSAELGCVSRCCSRST